MVNDYRACYKRFVFGCSQWALDGLVQSDRLERQQLARMSAKTEVKAVVDWFDLEAKILTKGEGIRIEKRKAARAQAFLYKTATGLVYEKCGYLFDAAFSYDRAARLAREFAADARLTEDKEMWTQRKLFLRMRSAQLFERIDKPLDSAYDHLYAAEAAQELGSSSLAKELAVKGITHFDSLRAMPSQNALLELYRQYGSQAH